MNPVLGGILIAFGAWLIYASLTDNPTWFALKRVRWIAGQLGRERARILYLGAGVLLIALGVAFTAGWLGRQ
ncbi:MAG: hypothetical protein LJE84_03655 [Gammaproteobacteria bacterium]|nr:hypothetical protein [Gammaproteobacteria bacterium]